jgi:octaprenyl-diphosphate synthase
MNLEQAIQATDDLMEQIVESEVTVLQEASRHIIAAGGKRVRPRLLFLAYELVGGTELEKAVPLSAAIELVHTATLVHDDINDHGTTRRGRVTVNERWGRTFALLTGDFLFTKVYELMAPYRDMNITFAEATVALVEGETLQAQAARDNQLNREIYQQIVAKKTASLFRAAAMLGAQLGRAEEYAVDALGEYGFYLGLAFQIVDDLLDLTGDPRLMGKDTNVDLSQGKGVAAAVGGKTNGNGHSTVALMDVEAPSEVDPILAIKKRLIAGGAVEEGRQMARVLAVQAEAVLAVFEDSPAKQELISLIQLVVERDH